MVEGARLESEYAPKAYPGFESLPLRQFTSINGKFVPFIVTTDMFAYKFVHKSETALRFNLRQLFGRHQLRRKGLRECDSVESLTTYLALNSTLRIVRPSLPTMRMLLRLSTRPILPICL